MRNDRFYRAGMNMKYLDSNVFIMPVLYKGKKAEKAKKILEMLSEGILSCATASLTLDEVLWVIIKQTHDRSRAIQICRDIMELPNLSILNVTAKDVVGALWFMDKYNWLKPRDAIHLGVCTNSGIFTIVTDDSDFNNVQEVSREGLE